MSLLQQNFCKMWMYGWNEGKILLNHHSLYNLKSLRYKVEHVSKVNKLSSFF